MQLLLDIGAQAHFLHRIDVARAGAERDAIEDVDDFGAVGRVGGQSLLRVRGACGKDRQEWHERQGQADSGTCHIGD